MWLRDLLPSYIPSIRVFSFAYELEGALSPVSLRLLAMSLLGELTEQRQLRNVGSHYRGGRMADLTLALQDKESLVFVGHDIGGMIIKQVEHQ